MKKKRNRLTKVVEKRQVKTALAELSMTAADALKRVRRALPEDFPDDYREVIFLHIKAALAEVANVTDCLQS